MKVTPMKDLRGYLTKEQVMCLIKNAGSLRNELLIRLMYYCGRRVSEVLMLTPNDIIYDEQIIIFKLEKKRGTYYLRVPINKETLDLLMEYIRKNKIGPKTRIFKLTRQHVYRIVRWAGERCGITHVGSKYLHPHTLRHSFAVHWIKGGGDLRKLQMILGHSDISTTAVYLQFSPTEIKETYDKIFG